MAGSRIRSIRLDVTVTTDDDEWEMGMTSPNPRAVLADLEDFLESDFDYGARLDACGE